MMVKHTIYPENSSTDPLLLPLIGHQWTIFSECPDIERTWVCSDVDQTVLIGKH